MVNYKKIILCCLLVICISLFFSIYQKKNNITLACDAEITYHSGDSSIRSMARYVFQGDKGFLTIHGRLYKDDQFISNISRRVYFDILSIGEKEVHLRSNNFTIYPTDNTSSEILKSIIPKFYINKETNLSLYIYKQNDNGYIFATEYVPLMYCQTPT